MAKKYFGVVFVSNPGSTVINIDEKNYKNIDAIYDQAYEEVSQDAGTDIGEIWIDDIMAEGFEFNVDWKDLLVDKKGILDPNMIEKALKDDEFVIKCQFLKESDMDIEDIDKYENEIIVIDCAHEHNWEDGNYGDKFPSSWVADFMEEGYSDLYKALQKNNADSYFDNARFLSDMSVNGDFTSTVIGDYFVYMLGHF